MKPPSVPHSLQAGRPTLSHPKASLQAMAGMSDCTTRMQTLAAMLDRNEVKLVDTDYDS